MSRKETIEKRTWELCLPLAQQLGLTLVDTEYVKEAGEYYLRIYIDRNGDTTIEDCEKMNGLVNPLLDEEPSLSDPYTLEVSSPGLGRVLRRPHDFEFASGKDVNVKTYRPVDGTKEFTGILKSWDAKQVRIEKKDGTLQTIDRDNISKISLAFDF